jgi:hypothetical protein
MPELLVDGMLELDDGFGDPSHPIRMQFDEQEQLHYGI